MRLNLASLWRRRCIRKTTSRKSKKNVKSGKKALLNEHVNWNLVPTERISKHVEEVLVSLTRGPGPCSSSGDKDLTDRQPSGTLLSWRWKYGVWRFLFGHCFVWVLSTVDTCLKLRFAHSPASPVNTRSYPGTIRKRTLERKNVLHVIENNEMPIKFFERKWVETDWSTAQ
jgi:hypothetical protein